jgi:short subunit dehydrogenase-like uncharacterized protein
MRRLLHGFIPGIFISLLFVQSLSAAQLPESIASQLPAQRDGQVLIYGAYGFSGSAIARLAETYGITPVLSGRNPEKLNVIAEELGFAQIPLTLDDHDTIVEVLSHFELVMHIAGPYTFTAEPMLDAAVEAGTHYVDLTGENHVIEAQLERDAEFRDANIMVMPAVGYDVVPTDCLNLHVAQYVENPTKLMLVMNGEYKSAEGAQASRGTIKSGLELLSRPALMRIDGKMVEVDKPKVITQEIDGVSQTLVQIQWADMVTSWVSTGIPTIEVYQQRGDMPGWIMWLIKQEWGKNLLIWLVDNYFPEGPPPEAQETRQTQLTATATNAAGESFSAEMITPEAYRLTFHSSLIIARRIIDGNWEAGFQTPAKMYGPDLALEIPGVTRRDLTEPGSFKRSPNSIRIQ